MAVEWGESKTDFRRRFRRFVDHARAVIDWPGRFREAGNFPGGSLFLG